MNPYQYNTQPLSHTQPVHFNHQARSNRIQQQLDDLRLVIESTSPIKHKNTFINHSPQRNESNYSQQQTDYLIQLQQDDGSNIDVTLKLSKQYQSPERRSPSQYTPLTYSHQTTPKSNRQDSILNQRYNQPSKYRQNYRDHKKPQQRKYRQINHDVEYNYSITYRDQEMRNNIKINYSDNYQGNAGNYGNFQKRNNRIQSLQQSQQEQLRRYKQEQRNQIRHQPTHIRHTPKQQFLHPSYPSNEHKTNKTQDTSMDLDISNSFNRIKQPNGQSFHNFEPKYKNTVENAPGAYTFGYGDNYNPSTFINGNNNNINASNASNPRQKEPIKKQRSQKTFGNISNNAIAKNTTPYSNNTNTNANANQTSNLNPSTYPNPNTNANSNANNNAVKNSKVSVSSNTSNMKTSMDDNIQPRQRQRQRERQGKIIKNHQHLQQNNREFWSQNRRSQNQQQLLRNYKSVNRQDTPKSPTFNPIEQQNQQTNYPSNNNTNTENNTITNFQDTFKKQKRQPQQPYQSYRPNPRSPTNNRPNVQSYASPKINDKKYFSSQSKNQTNNITKQEYKKSDGNASEKNNQPIPLSQGNQKTQISYFNKQRGGIKNTKRQKFQSIKIQEQSDKKSNNNANQDNRSRNVNPSNYSSNKKEIVVHQNQTQNTKNPTSNSDTNVRNTTSVLFKTPTSPSQYQSNNYNSGTKSPYVMQYQQQEQEQPIREESKPSLHNNAYDHYQRERQYQTERQRQPPYPYQPFTERRHNNGTPKQGNNQPTTVEQKNKNTQNSSKPKLVRLPTFQAVSNTKRISNSPIIVPMKKIPKIFNTRIKTETNISTGNVGEAKRVKISLNTSEHRAQIQRSRQIDIFAINKQKYLNKLRKQQNLRSKSRTNRLHSHRTLSKNSRSQLSPQCQHITNRLYQSRINKQPCPKYIQYKQTMNRLRMKQTLGEYTFIRRYLTDDEIFQMIQQFEKTGVPEKKWPVKLIDVVYNKLRSMRAL